MTCEPNQVTCGARGGLDINDVICSWVLFSHLEQVRLGVMDFMTSSYFLREKTVIILLMKTLRHREAKTLVFPGWQMILVWAQRPKLHLNHCWSFCLHTNCPSPNRNAPQGLYSRNKNDLFRNGTDFASLHRTPLKNICVEVIWC